MNSTKTGDKGQKACLIIGPTGSGKTPLGNLLEKKGLRGTSCFHFDFGEELRMIDKSGLAVSPLSKSDLQIIHHSLMTGALLENKNFDIARKILWLFIRREGLITEDVLFLNGLPRHVGQAEDLRELVRVEEVVYLRCRASVIRSRLKHNPAGDRTGRNDDSSDAVEKKMEVFHTRTRPLLDYYQRRKVKVVEFQVSTDTRPEEIREFLEKE
ncbi:nucleoside monophosphate kinase [Fibrobacterota bacterium]